MRLTRSISSIALCGVVVIFAGGASNCNPTPPSVDITILHTNDVHSHFKAEPINSEKNPYGLGGLAKLKTLVSQIRASNPNTILLDAGDWSEATTYFNVDAGSNMLELMSAIGYDAAVVGNHDFLNGPSELANTIERASPRFPVLGANKDLTALSSAEQTRVAKDLPPYTILNVGGIKVGVIGLLCNDFFYYGYFKPAVVTDPVATATAIAENLHNNKLADVIVLLSHNSIGLNTAWARTVPWVNLVVSGHTHAKTPTVITTSNGGNPAYIAEAKQWGQFLGELTLTVTPSTGKVVLKSFNMLPVASSLADDPTVAALITAQDNALNAKYGKDIVGDSPVQADDEMGHDDNREVPLSNMTADSYRAATGADIALESVQLNGDGIQAGPVSTLQLMNIAPHIYHPVAGQSFPQSGSTWTLKNLPIDGTSLRGLLNLTFLADSFGLIGWIAQSGARITWSPNGGASQVQNIKILNSVTGAYEDLVDTKTYHVVFHDGLLMAINILIQKLSLNIDLSHMQETGISTGQAVVDFATAKGRLRAADYLPGTRYNATTADLAFFDSDVQLTPKGGTNYVVGITIHNISAVATSPGQFTMNVAASAPNDVITDFAYNALDTTNVVGQAPIPPLAPGASATVQIPWNNAASGVYSVLFKLTGGSDASAVNNSFVHHMHVGVP